MTAELRSIATCLMCVSSSSRARASTCRRRGHGLRRHRLGRVDGYWEFGLNPWDIAAGVLLVREAGGTVSDMEGGTLDLMRPRLLATNGKIHDEMTQKLAELLRSG